MRRLAYTSPFLGLEDRQWQLQEGTIRIVIPESRVTSTRISDSFLGSLEYPDEGDRWIGSIWTLFHVSYTS